MLLAQDNYFYTFLFEKNDALSAVHKGQLISKGLFSFVNSPKNRTKNFCPIRLEQKINIFKFVFWKNWRHQNGISKLTDL